MQRARLQRPLRVLIVLDLHCTQRIPCARCHHAARPLADTPPPTAGEPGCAHAGMGRNEAGRADSSHGGATACDLAPHSLRGIG